MVYLKSLFPSKSFKVHQNLFLRTRGQQAHISQNGRPPTKFAHTWNNGDADNPLLFTLSQPIYGDKTKRGRKVITAFHASPCLINLSALSKQANGSVGGSRGNTTNDQLLPVKPPRSHSSHLSAAVQQLRV